MRIRRTGWLVLAGAIVAPMFIVGCKAPPPRSPKILGSMRPPVGMQAPPVNSKTPVLVPTAPLAQARPVAPAYAVPAQTAVPVQTGAVAVPVQPGNIAQPSGAIAVPPQGNVPQMVVPQQSLPPRPGEAPQTNRSTNRPQTGETPFPEPLDLPPEPN
jgi:hypothetical protein